MKIVLDDALLREMFALSAYIVPQDEMVFVALRGVQPLAFGGGLPAASQELIHSPVDYLHMRCCIVQWHTGLRMIAAFVGSTVPHISNINAALAKGGVGVNQLASGYFGNVPGMPDHRYVKGNHGEDRHLAFRNESRLPVVRTADDTDFDGNDRYEYDIVYDNLHCARNANEALPYFSSKGCVVVGGTVGKSGAHEITSEQGPWKTFLANAYYLDQRFFTLALFEQNEALRSFELGTGKRAPTVRFGSRGMLVRRVQAALLDKGYNIGGNPDGLFGNYTARALRDFQHAGFGAQGADLIVGPATAAALEIAWPQTGDELKISLEPAVTDTGDDEPLVTASTAALEANVAVASPAAALIHDPKLLIRLDTTHMPLPGWDVSKGPPDTKGRPTWRFGHAGVAPTYLGYFMDYNGYSDGPTRGLARTAGASGGLAYNPADWTDFGHWPELIFPTAWAESNASFTVINAWDRAGITLGFIQLAAHTGDDLLPYFRRLLSELPDEARQWFPELGVVDGKLCFIANNRYRSIEDSGAPSDGGYTASYYHGDLMGFFNPDRYHRGAAAIDNEELQASARWLAWTLSSRKMREIQVAASIENVGKSVQLLHRAMQADSKVVARYPKGVDGMCCDLLSVAVAAPHLGDGHLKKVIASLGTADPVEAIRVSNYGPGGRSQNVHDGMLKRPALKQLVYDLSKQKPV